MKKKGFTLIEIISAIVIIGIIALITVPITLRVINEAKKKSFLVTAEGIVKSATFSLADHEEEYESYFVNNDFITFKFSKSEGKEGESVDEINGKKVKLAFGGKSPIGGEVNLYKNGDVEVINLTDGTFYVNKDVDTEMEILENSSSATRSELQEMVEDLKREVKNIKEENTSQATEITNLKNAVKENEENCVTKVELETVNTVVKQNQSSVSTLNTKMSELGKHTAVEWGTKTTVPANTYTKLATITFPKSGSYLVNVQLGSNTFPTALNKPIVIGLSTITTGSTHGGTSFYGSSFSTQFHVSIGTDKTFYVLAYQNTSESLIITSYIGYRKIGF